MLLKCRTGKILFIDATSNEGVAICSWEEFSKRAYYRFYDKIVYRPLQFKRNYKNQTMLEDFLRKVVGKKYKLSPMRMLQKYSVQDSVANTAEKNGYFCSELVATVFKLLGFLPAKISSSQYWPGSFSAETKLALGNGAAFGHEYLIEFPPAENAANDTNSK